MYRTPDSPNLHFKETLENIDDWIKSIEKDIKTTPVIILNGDFNMKDMKSWSAEEIRLHLEKVHDRIENGETVRKIKEQTKMLCEFTQDFFIHQIIEHSTRKSNLLDLVFCNEDDLFTNQTVIENVLMSHHKIVIL